MNKISIQYYKTPAGQLIIGSYKDTLCLCDWQYRRMRTSIDKRIQKLLDAEYVEEETPVIKQTKQQLQEYFEGERQSFDLPLHLAGTDFQVKVWETLIKVKYGKTETYMGLSKQLNNEKAIRAVASANGANAISIIVPCHRIIGSNGDLVGYAGGLPAKKKLLNLEQKTLGIGQLNLFEG